MKKALVDKNGRICQIAEEEFPVHSDLKWVEVSEEAKPEDRWESNKLVKPTRKAYVETYLDKRLKAYGSPQDQLEYITENGLEAWQTHVATIKELYPKD